VIVARIVVAMVILTCSSCLMSKLSIHNIGLPLAKLVCVGGLESICLACVDHEIIMHLHGLTRQSKYKV